MPWRGRSYGSSKGGRNIRSSKYTPKAITSKRSVKAQKYPAARLKFTRPMKSLLDTALKKGRETKSVTVLQPLTPILAAIKGVVADASTPSAPMSMIRCCPQVVQGDGSSLRVGNRINAVSLTVYGFIYMNPSVGNDTTNTENMSGINLRLYIATSKKRKGYAALSAQDQAAPNYTGYTKMAQNLLEQNAVNGAYDGTLNTHQQWKVNHTEVTVHHKRNYHIKRNLIFDPNSGYQNLVKIPFSFKIPTSKFIDFDNDADNNPSAVAPLLLAGWCYDNGAAPSSDSTLYPQIIMTTVLKYTDP